MRVLCACEVLPRGLAVCGDMVLRVLLQVMSMIPGFSNAIMPAGVRIHRNCTNSSMVV